MYRTLGWARLGPTAQERDGRPGGQERGLSGGLMMSSALSGGGGRGAVQGAAHAAHYLPHSAATAKTRSCLRHYLLVLLTSNYLTRTCELYRQHTVIIQYSTEIKLQSSVDAIFRNVQIGTR